MRQGGQSSGPLRSALSQLSLPWPSAPAAKPRGLTIGAACVLFRIFEEHLLASEDATIPQHIERLLVTVLGLLQLLAVRCPTIMTGKAKSRQNSLRVTVGPTPNHQKALRNSSECLISTESYCQRNPLAPLVIARGDKTGRSRPATINA